MGANGWLSMKNKKENTNKNLEDPHPVVAGNSGPHGGHEALWGGRVIHAGHQLAAVVPLPPHMLCANTLYYNYALYYN